MKKRTLGSIIFAVFIGGIMVLPTAVSAKPTDELSKGFIKFNEDKEGAKIGDPENPESSIDELKEPIVVNLDRSDFSVDAVTNLHFGSDHKVGVTNTDRKFFANSIKTKSAGKEITRGNFVQFTDKRATLNHKYTLTAQMTRSFEITDKSARLKGADVTFTNGVVTSTTQDSLWPAVTNDDGAKLVKTVAPFTLGPAGDGVGAGSSHTVITNNDPNRGIGTYFVEFGQYADGTAEKDTSGKSVELRIPSTVNLVADEYTADITWTLSDI